eukprot:2265218-Alexandrium_andersonii.AAC.1
MSRCTIGAAQQAPEDKELGQPISEWLRDRSASRQAKRKEKERKHKAKRADAKPPTTNHQQRAVAQLSCACPRCFA